jgi:hypothetical protein
MDIKQKAKECLASTDYAMLSDIAITNLDDFKQYRWIMRNIIMGNINASLEDPLFELPQPVWADSASDVTSVFTEVAEETPSEGE